MAVELLANVLLVLSVCCAICHGVSMIAMGMEHACKENVCVATDFSEALVVTGDVQTIALELDIAWMVSAIARQGTMASIVQKSSQQVCLSV
jgi:hypothetical protein